MCVTNHALDSFLEDLRKSGVTKLARLGGNSKEAWTKQFHISTISRAMKRTTLEKTSLSSSRAQIEGQLKDPETLHIGLTLKYIGLTTEGTSWCESINTQSLSWPAVRELLISKYPETLQSFTPIQQVEESRISDIRLARKAGGFAFEFWCTGGDIHDIDRLLAHFSTLLESTHEFQDDAKDHEIQTRSRVLDKIFWNASAAAQTNTTSETGVWRMTLRERQTLLQNWQEEINPRTILDRTAEIHRRHQAAVRARSEVIQNLDARCLSQRKF